MPKAEQGAHSPETHVFMSSALPRQAQRSSTLLLAEEEVWQEVGDILIELVLWRQKDGLVVDRQQEEVEEEEPDNAQDHHDVGGNAILFQSHAGLGIQWL